MFSTHQFLEFLASLDVLVAEDVFDIFVTAGCRGQPVVHGVAAGLSKNMHEPKLWSRLFPSHHTSSVYY